MRATSVSHAPVLSIFSILDIRLSTLRALVRSCRSLTIGIGVLI